MGGFEHALGGVGLTGMQRQRQAGLAHELQGLGMGTGRETGFGAGKVEADHALAPVADGQARGAQRLRRGQMTHGADDQPAGQRAVAQALQQRLHGRFATQAVDFEEQRRDAEFGQHCAVGTGVLGGLESDAPQRLRAGHGRHREGKAFEVFLQAAGVGVGVEPGRQAGLVGGRWRDAALAQQLQQGGHAQAAVQVLVQQHLGQCASHGVGRQVGCSVHGWMLATAVPGTSAGTVNAFQ